MSKESKSDKFYGLVFGCILACLFTGGIASSFHWNVPVVCIITCALVASYVYGQNDED